MLLTTLQALLRYYARYSCLTSLPTNPYLR